MKGIDSFQINKDGIEITFTRVGDNFGWYFRFGNETYGDYINEIGIINDGQCYETMYPLANQAAQTIKQITGIQISELELRKELEQKIHD